MDLTQITLIIGTVLLALGYICIFICSVNRILEAFSDQAKERVKYYKKFGYYGFSGFTIYCGVFAISCFINVEKLANFTKDTNDKVFGFLFAALIIQFLSFLFSRQNYDYQNKLANNKAKADRIENIIKYISGSIVGYGSAMLSVVEFEGKQLIIAKQLKAARQQAEGIETEEIKQLQAFNEDIQRKEALKRAAKLNEESANWQMAITSIQSDFNALYLSPLNRSIEKIMLSFVETLGLVTTNNSNINKAATIQMLNQNSIEPHRVMISTVMQTIANAARIGMEIPCPSEKQLDDFLAYNAELKKWIKSTERLR